MALSEVLLKFSIVRLEEAIFAVWVLGVISYAVVVKVIFSVAEGLVIFFFVVERGTVNYLMVKGMAIFFVVEVIAFLIVEAEILLAVSLFVAPQSMQTGLGISLLDNVWALALRILGLPRVVPARMKVLGA